MFNQAERAQVHNVGQVTMEKYFLSYLESWNPGQR